jgi:hypothetical protein
MKKRVRDTKNEDRKYTGGPMKRNSVPVARPAPEVAPLSGKRTTLGDLFDRTLARMDTWIEECHVLGIVPAVQRRARG